MVDETKTENAEESSSEQMPIEYTKSNYFRVIHGNGVIGGISGLGELHFGFYSERKAFPDTGILKFSPNADGLPSEQIQGGDKFIREIEADIVVDIETAKRIRHWLDSHIKNYETLIQKAIQEQQNAGKNQ